MKFFSTIFLILCLFSSSEAQQTVGLFQNDPESQNGYTLFSSSKTTYLIDNCGEKVHQWDSDFRPGAAVYLMPDGNLLRTNRIPGAFNAGGSGGGFEILDKSNEQLWTYEVADDFQHSHHDVSILPNGNILIIVWDLISELESIQLGRKQIAEIWSEKIVELEPIGNNQANIVWEWKLRDHLVQDHDSMAMNFGQINDHPELVDFNYLGDGAAPDGDWAHINGIDYHEATDQIAVTSRHFGEVWILDHSTSTEEAATSNGGNFGKGGDLLYRYGNPFAYKRGTQEDQLFVGPHSPSWTSANSMMVFNNVYTTENSSVERWTLPMNQDGQYTIIDTLAYGPVDVDWRYIADNFSSKIMSSAQELPNGNILICEAIDGRFFEVTMDQQKVWEYVNPVRSNDMIFNQGDATLQTETFHVNRYLPNDSRLQDYDLTSSGPIEFNPIPSNCTVTDLNYIDKNKLASSIKILGNPVRDKLRFLNLGQNKFFAIADLTGRIIKPFQILDLSNEIDVFDYPKGMYFLLISDDQAVQTIKWVKM